MLIEKALAPLFPAWALSRLQSRAAFDSLRAHYDGAKLGRRTKNWHTPSTSALAESRVSLQRLRDRSRDLIRNNPYAAHGFYKEDVDFIQDYVRSSEANRKGDGKTWEDYLQRHVFQPEDHYAYLETVGIRKLLGLYTHPIVSW